MIGTKLADRYEIVSELGRGGMGVVYRARDPRLNREVAVKLIPPSQLTPEAEQRFEREAQLVAQMDHPAIVPIYDFGRHEGALYFVMALVQGTNLRAFLRQDSRLIDVVDLGIQVAEALDYSHARGVVHRDIKPENIMVTREEGVGVRVRVMDFGLARASSESRMTRTGTLMGTLAYMSPEQITGSDLQGPSDIYALGTVLYECVVGEPPFSGEAQAVVYRIVHEFPQAPRDRGADVDEALESIILGSLQKEPGRRPQRAGEVAEALRRYRAGLRDSERSRNVTDLTRAVNVQRPSLAPFIGREKERAELQQRLNAALAGDSQVVLIGGDAGIGKTRLLDEIETLAKARQIRVLHGRFLEQDRGLPYQGILEILLDYFGLKESGSAPPPDLSDLAPDLVVAFPSLGEIPEIRSAAGGSGALDRRGPATPESRTQLFELLARTLIRLAGARPLVLLLEDLHAAEVSIDALEYIVRRFGRTPILVVGTYRSTELTSRHPLNRMIEGLQGERRAATLVLGPLTPAEHRSFLETLVGPGMAEGLFRKLYTGSEGNPFFTKELVRSLVDSGGLVRDGSGAWSLSAEAGLAADALPATIQKAVEKRVGRLPDELREVLAVASVMGTSFDVRDLAQLMQVPDVDDAIDRLVEQGLIEEERESRGDTLRFSSGVVHDVLYAGLSPRKRRSLHRRSVELLEARYAGRLDRVLPQLVRHSVQGDVPEKAVEYALRSARTSLDAFSVEDAIRFATTALTFLDAEWEGPRAIEGDARLLLARAQRTAGDLDTASREIASAVRIFEQAGDSARLTGALVLAAEIGWQARKTDEMGRAIAKGLPVARAASDTDGLRQLLPLAATLANLAGEYDQANAYLEEAARLGADGHEGEATEQVPAGGRIVVAMANPIADFEPGRYSLDEEVEIGATIYETLLATDSDGHLVPWLCEKWEFTEGSTRLALTLRRDIRFSDGTPLTAAGAKRAFEATIRLATTLPAAFAAILGVNELAGGTALEVAGIEVKGEHELEIRLSEPLPIYLALLTEANTAIARPAGGEAGPARLGTGPFRLVAREPDRVLLERNPAYWRSGLPRLDAIEFRPALSGATIAKRLRTGELDLARDLLPEDLEDTLREAQFRAGLVQSAKKNIYFLLFNCRTGPAAHVLELRRALSGVLRPRELVWRTLGRFAAPASGLIPPGMLGHDPGRRWPALGRQEALDLIESAGLARPIRLRATVQPLLRDKAQALLAGLFGLWAELGVEVQADSGDTAAYLESWNDCADIDLLIGRWNADYDDPDNITRTLFRSGTGGLHRYFSSPESDRVLDEARAESRPAARESLYRSFEELLLDAAALVPLYHDIDYRIGGPRVRGLVLRGTQPYVNYAELGAARAVAPVVEARRGGGLIQIPLVGALASTDPMQPSTRESSEVLHGIFETLTRQSGFGGIVPWLASEVRVEESGRRYRIRLRDDVTFHDGRKLGARDVRYSFERLLRSGGTTDRELYSSIRGAQALFQGEARELAGLRIQSATELTIELEEPIGFFPALLSHSAAAIIPEGGEPLAGAAPSAWVGTGPFRIVAFDPGRRLTLERNPSYWRRGYPRSEGVVLHFGVTPKEILAGFRDGRFSMAWDLVPSDLDELRREPDFAAGYRETPCLVSYFVAFNTAKGPLADRALRRNLVRAVDVPKLVRQTLGRLAVPARGLIPPGLLGHDAATGSRLEPVAPAESETLAGTLELTAAVHPVFLSTYAGFLRELSGAFAACGVRVRPVTPTMAEFMTEVDRGQVDLVIGRWNADYPDPDTFAYTLHSEFGFLGRLCGSAETDRLVVRARTESAPAVRRALYLQLEQIVTDEALLLPLFLEQAYRLGRPELEGLSVSVAFPVVAFEDLRLRG